MHNDSKYWIQLSEFIQKVEFFNLSSLSKYIALGPLETTLNVIAQKLAQNLLF